MRGGIGTAAAQGSGGRVLLGRCSGGGSATSTPSSRDRTGGATYIHLRRQGAYVQELRRARALYHDDARDRHQRCRSAEDGPPAQHAPANPQRVNPSPGRPGTAYSAGTAAKNMQRRGYASPVAAGTARQHAASHPRSLAVRCSFRHLAAEAIPRPGERAMPPHPFALRKICSLQAESKSKMRRLV